MALIDASNASQIRHTPKVRKLSALSAEPASAETFVTVTE